MAAVEDGRSFPFGARDCILLLDARMLYREMRAPNPREVLTMPAVQLVELAHARSGDKGDVVNIGVIAYEPEHYPLLADVLTPGRVQEHFGDMVKGTVARYELPNLHALNFVLPGALGGGGTVSLMMDAQGKVFSTALLRMEVEVPDEVARRVRGRGRAPRYLEKDETPP